MNLENYRLYLIGTVDTFSSKVNTYIKKKFIDKYIAYEDQMKLSIQGKQPVDIFGLTLKDQIKKCLLESEDAVKIFEEWEFEKDYKYSVLFEVDNFENVLVKVRDTQKMESNQIENERLSSVFENPIGYSKDDMFFLKFNLKFASFHPITQEELLLKYPFIVVFHEKYKLVEFRFDVLRKVFVSDYVEQKIYSDLVSKMRMCLEEMYSCTIKALPLDFMISTAKTGEDIKLIAQYMKFASGGNAQLEVGNNQEYVLPLIGELKSLIVENEESLKKAPDLKEALEQFIYEKEEMSEYPWIEVLWEQDIKTRSIHVKFIFSSDSIDYTLIQHYYSNVLIGMERMNYVTDYISRHREVNISTESAR